MAVYPITSGFRTPACPVSLRASLESLPDLSDEALSLVDQASHDFRWGRGLLVLGRPNDHLNQDRQQIEPLGCRPIADDSRVSLRSGSRDDAMFPERFETIRENVRGDAFIAFLKLLECRQALDHQVSENQQRPAVAQDFQGDV